MKWKNRRLEIPFTEPVAREVQILNPLSNKGFGRIRAFKT